MSAAKTYLRSAGQATSPATSIVQQLGAPAAPAVAMVTVPQFDDNGQIIQDVSGKAVLKRVPANSPQAMYACNAKIAWMHTPVGMILAAIGFSAVSFGAAYAGTRLAFRDRSPKAKSFLRDRRSGKSPVSVIDTED